MQKQKRIAAIHDISCFGKCSLTVALPVLSAAGFEACCIPTSVFSTHTGGFSGDTFHDLTKEILPIADHWKSQGFAFDAVYTGFLGTAEQTDIICDVLDRIADENTLIMVDPVMGDNGKLYPVFSESFPTAMKKLCARANVMIPNMTEAYLLLGERYQPGPYTEAEINHLLDGLTTICKGEIVLTGVHFDDRRLGTATLDIGTGQRTFVLRDRIDGMYHGTGDVYASSFLAALMHDFSLPEAAAIAADYTVLSIETTKKMDKDLRYGVNFEYNIPNLIEMLKKEHAE
ncbi:MAG: pyridoxamine kinase [Clostridia bacterium]|nr:pyridoxamine kinase [Clostridia bacterium]